MSNSGESIISRTIAAGILVAGLVSVPAVAWGQAAAAPAPGAGAIAADERRQTPPDYLIGPDDLLQIVFWRENDLSAEVRVRPDGRISLPLLNEVMAAGTTPSELQRALVERARQYITDPNATVLVKEIRSRRAFITGSVEKPGSYLLPGPTTVLQLIALAGGLKEYADKKDLVIMRTVNGRQVSYPFDYHSVSRRMKLEQNIELRPGDMVIVR